MWHGHLAHDPRAGSPCHFYNRPLPLVSGVCENLSGIENWHPISKKQKERTMKKFIVLSILLLPVAPMAHAERMINGVRVLTTKEELIDPSRSAVIVVDMQNGWCSTQGMGERGNVQTPPADPNKHAVKPAYAEQVKNTQKLIARARKAGVPIV